MTATRRRILAALVLNVPLLFIGVPSGTVSIVMILWMMQWRRA